MIQGLFDSLLEELGRAINISNLHADRNNSCLIHFPNNLKIQIELDKKGDSLIIGADLGALYPGKYKENILRAALKTNNQPPPLHGVLAFSTKKECLVLFELLPLRELSGDKIAEALPLFSEKALKWKEALARGEVPVVATFHTSGGGLFSLVK